MYNDNRLLANETIVTDVLMFSSFLEDTRIPNEYPCVLAKLGKKLMIFSLYVYIFFLLQTCISPFSRYSVGDTPTTFRKIREK